MDFPTPIPVKEIARQYRCEIIGDDTILAKGINGIHKVRKGDIVFVDLQKYFKKALRSVATIILLNQRTECPPGKVLLLCDQPFEVYNAIVKSYRPIRALNAMVSDSAVIAPSTIIEPNVIIGNHVRIGKQCHIHANVTIQDYTIIGDRVEVDSGTVIGSSAFYFKKQEKGYTKWKSGGKVIIEDDVYIGANCTINKGVSGDTIIGAGTKIDCLVHIAHGAEIGKRCLIAAQAGISGKVIIEDEVTIYGQAGIAHGVRVGTKAVIGAQSGVSKDLEGHKIYQGAPAGEIRQVHREMAALRQLPEFIKEIRRK